MELRDRLDDVAANGAPAQAEHARELLSKFHDNATDADIEHSRFVQAGDHRNSDGREAEKCSYCSSDAAVCGPRVDLVLAALLVEGGEGVVTFHGLLGHVLSVVEHHSYLVK